MARSLSAVLLLSLAAAGCGSTAQSDACGTGSNPACIPPIAGRVLDELGVPVAGAKVALMGTAVPAATTDLQGKFSFAGLGHAYDIAAAAASSTAVVYLGLTRSDPTLTLPSLVNGSSAIGWLQLDANPTRSDAGFYASAAFIPPGTTRYHGYRNNSTTYPIEVFVQWANASSTVSGTAVVFEYVTPNWVRVGSATGAVLTDGVHAGFDVPMTAVTSGTVTGTTVAAEPSSQTVWNTLLNARVENVSYAIAGMGSGGAFSFPAPIGSGFPLTISSKANDSFGGSSTACKSVAPTSTGVSLTVPLGPVQTAPPNNTIDVDGSTNFSWTDPGSVFKVQLDRSTAPAFSNRLAIYTTSKSARIPDLSSVGFSFPSGTAMTWSVTGSLPGFGVIGQTVDDTASAPWVVECGSSYTETATRAFTLK